MKLVPGEGQSVNLRHEPYASQGQVATGWLAGCAADCVASWLCSCAAGCLVCCKPPSLLLLQISITKPVGMSPAEVADLVEDFCQADIELANYLYVRTRPQHAHRGLPQHPSTEHTQFVVLEQHSLPVLRLVRLHVLRHERPQVPSVLSLQFIV